MTVKFKPLLFLISKVFLQRTLKMAKKQTKGKLHFTSGGATMRLLFFVSEDKKFFFQKNGFHVEKSSYLCSRKLFGLPMMKKGNNVMISPDLTNRFKPC